MGRCVVGLRGKVSAQLCCRGHIRTVERSFAVAPAVVAAGKESLILDDGTRKGRSELVLAKWKNLGSSRNWVEIRYAVARIESVVADVFEGRAVERTSSGCRYHVHHTACRAAKLRFGVVSNDFELLDQIDVRDDNICRPAHVCVDYAVKKVELRAVLLSMERSIRETRPGDSNISFATSNALVLGRRNGSDTRSQGQ